MDNSSSEETSSSDYSTESSEDDGMEIAQIGNVKIQLPQGLCERQDLFREILSTETWNSLSEENRQHLQTFLPNFPEDDELEKTKTLQRLFDFEVFKFTSPLVKFHDDLKAGYFRPDIARMRKIIRKAERNESKYRYKMFRKQLKDDIIESRDKLLSQVRNLPPGVDPKQEKRKINVDYVSYRTKRRYFQTLQSIKSKTDDTGCSSDENYPEGPPTSLSRKQKRHLNSIRNSLNNSKEEFHCSTMFTKLNGSQVDLERYITPNFNPFYINDESYKNMIYQHKKRKLNSPDDPELNIKGFTLTDIINRTQLPYNKNMPMITKHLPESKSINRKKIKKESRKPSEHSSYSINNKFKSNYDDHSSNSDSDSDSIMDNTVSKTKHKIKLKHTKSDIKKETTNNNESMPSSSNVLQPINSITQYGKITPACVEDLDGIDVMNIPIDLDNSDIDILELNNKPELMQDTHANFFSLIRDVICSTCDHRMNMYTLQERLKTWQENPISPLNDWYSSTDNWIGILPSAITFLCGNASEQPDDFVPYMEYKSNLDVYQWIGAGRDSDNLLSCLCSFWLEHKSDGKDLSSNKEELDVDITDRSSSPPPPRYPTTWTVRKATPEEIKTFREQERRRYDNPHKAFTYRCNNYESVVGPIKGIYNPAVGNSKARGHTMLSADRPNFVTILSLVRDAAARLPNGEGTRAEICELLKSSQYISSTAPDNVLQSVVSGALDRMHTQWDPCVKYDPKKKIWIYLHRNRTEEDFERIHQQYQGVNKTNKKVHKKPSSKSKGKQSPEKPVKTVKSETTPTAPPAPLQPPPLQETTQRRTSVAMTTAQVQNPPLPNLITVTAPQKGTSLLLSNNLPKTQVHIQESVLQSKPVISDEPPPLAAASNITLKQTKEDTDINKTFQTIIQNRVASPTLKSGKSLVKILSPSHGKSLIIPTTNAQLIKQIQDQRTAPNKQIGQVVTQQFLQTIAAQQKQLLVQKQNQGESSENQQEKMKVPVSVQQQILQLQNVKNVTLLRASPTSNVGLSPLTGAPGDPGVDQTNIVTVSVTKSDQIVGQPSLQIKSQSNLSQAQQQQILQTIKQKLLPNSGLLANPQQIILKQKTGLINVQKSGMVPVSTHVVAHQKITADLTKSGNAAQTPVVAKVLTNAAGQVISVESLLPQQKQTSVLSQGTTLRVSGSKSGQQNLIHLTGSSKSNALNQLTVGSQNNILTLTTQPKFVVASQSTTSTSSATVTKSSSRSINKTQTLTKINTKTNQQLINAKLIQGIDGQKTVHPKLLVGQSNQIRIPAGKNTPKSLTLNVTGNTNTIRMVNAANLNLGHLGGKPILLASSKGGAIQNIQGQNVILQTQSGSSARSLVLQNALKSTGNNVGGQQSVGNNINIINQPNIVFSPQVKVQSPQQVMFTSTKSGQVGQTQTVSQGHIMIGGHPVRLQTSNAANTQRVVLASQGQGGQILAQQILLPAGFQGTAINIKALQGVKVIPITQTTGQNKGIQSRQVLAHVVNPNAVKSTAQTTTISSEKISEITLPTQEGE
ncbi:nuclear factor related to kappa-B-binding protein [Diorhabda sublineata]|uniref:nuclear factor related to kappa-B-binding protein n=1 Tax=Diorhabda sublineata TaxID=1163346 RepID=UPI0024E0E7A0|nr:nuclear factor related to kappa-B-binding protein [Diorhabda sublineata]XP_056642706.1 nuclear factor related to kappa-B-binding protein [Diorhabda sublineata]XP_056642707.1 nuclear factor related to kappa-B-binding protein [Diorhabda sublineata]